jgi:poly(hydroxyalkanoate) granule-associated protein
MMKHNGSTHSADSQLARFVRGSADQVWQAGRGAFSLAESEGGRLVGGLLGMRSRFDHSARSRVFVARTSASEAWDRLEGALRHRVSRALNALQIPTARDVQELTRRVHALQDAVVALERQAAAAQAPRKAARNTAARRNTATARGKGAASEARKAPRPAHKAART